MAFRRQFIDDLIIACEEGLALEVPVGTFHPKQSGKISFSGSDPLCARGGFFDDDGFVSGASVLARIGNPGDLLLFVP
jgi:hypothetical protein